MATPRQVAFHTLGCKLNFSETSSIRAQFEQAGYGVIPFGEAADVFVINTCSVTDFADRKCRQVVRRALRSNPDAKIIVVGCYAQLKPQEIAEIPGVDLVLGAAEKFQILDFIDSIEKSPSKGMVRAGEIQHVRNFEAAFSFGDRTRSFLKVQDGCDYKCCFCTIPQARGKSRSASISSVVEQAIHLADQGCKEIVLTGVNIGDFRFENNGKTDHFIDLVKALDEVEGIRRFRISSIEPNLCSDEIISFVAQSKRFMPHFHMPLQSGSNKILGKMRRRYKRELYEDRVHHIKSLMPHACIGVDVIVGFPGETEEDFNESYRFIQQLDVSYLHVFTYSERDNTLAAVSDGSVPMHVRRERNQQLRSLSAKKKRQFYLDHLNQTREVLVEKSKEPGMLSGHTDNYIHVSFEQDDLVSVNQLVDCLLTDFSTDEKIKVIPQGTTFIV